MSDRYNIYDWVGNRSKERLKQLLSKYDIKVDESKQNKGQVLSQVLNSLQTAPEVFELKKLILTPDPLDKNFIELQNDEKRLIQLLCNVAVKRKQIQHSIDEAISTFTIAEKMKEMHDIIGELTKKEENEKVQMLQQAYQVQIQQIEQQMRDNLARLQKQAMSNLLRHKENIDKLDKEIFMLKEERKVVFEQGIADAIVEHKEIILPSGSSMNDYMSDHQATKIQEDLALEIIKSKKSGIKEIEAIDKELTEIDDKKTELAKVTSPIRTSSDLFTPSFNGSQKVVNPKIALEIAKLDDRARALSSRKAQILQAEPKLKDNHYYQKFDELLDKHGVQKDKIPQQDKTALAKQFVDKGKEIAKKDLEIRAEIKDKKTLKERELNKFSEIKSEFDNLSNNLYSSKNAINLDDLFSSLNSETSAPTKNKQQKR